MNEVDRTDWAGKGAEEDDDDDEDDDEEEDDDDAEELEEIELLRLTLLGGCACSSVALEVDDFAETTGLLGGIGLTPFPRGAFEGFVEEALLDASSSSALSSLLLSLLLSRIDSFATALFFFDVDIEFKVFALMIDFPVVCGTSV